MNIQRMKKSRAGFTLVELIVVIAILAILAGVAIPVYSNYVKKANKAADEQLLAALNTAFAAACLENGKDAKLLSTGNGPSMPLIDGNGGKIVDMDHVSPYPDSFRRYFAGNEDSSFKTISALKFVNGVFVEDDGSGSGSTTPTLLTYTTVNGDLTYTAEAIQAYLNSGFSSRYVDEWTETIDGLTSMVSHGSALNSLKNDSQFSAFLTAKGISASENTKVSQALVSFAAEKLSTLSAAELVGVMNGDFDHDLQAVSNLLSGGSSSFSDKAVAAAFLYSMAGAYASTTHDNEYDFFDTDSLDISNTASFLGAMSTLDSDAYKTYFQSHGETDAAGFLGLMQTFAQNEDTINSFLSNGGYSNVDLVDALNAIIASQNP